MLVHCGRNVLRLPIEERRQLLAEALRKVQYPVIQSTPFDDENSGGRSMIQARVAETSVKIAQDSFEQAVQNFQLDQ